MELRINQEDIDKHIIKAVTDSMLGLELEKNIQKAFKEIKEKSYNNPIDIWVSRAVSEMVQEKITNSEEVKKQVDALITQFINDGRLTKVIEKNFENILSKSSVSSW